MYWIEPRLVLGPGSLVAFDITPQPPSKVYAIIDPALEDIRIEMSPVKNEYLLVLKDLQSYERCNVSFIEIEDEYIPFRYYYENGIYKLAVLK